MIKMPPELFVRGKYQLARYEPGSSATGRQLTEFEVRAAYDPKVFAEIDEHLSAVLLRSRGAIERALRTQRKRLNVTRKQLASAAAVSFSIVDDAETDAAKCELRDLEHLAFVLGLDPAQLSVHETARADMELGVRLRVLTHHSTTQGRVPLGPRTVLRFSEAASIILAQSRLQHWLEKPEEASGFEASSDYSFPTWRAGFRLAGQARERLGIGVDPIDSMRELVENRLGIPIIQLELSEAIAGATISSHGHRGIVLNVKGANSNVWVRRTTLAHELAHILFDPEENLESIRVDSYDQLDRNTQEEGRSQDYDNVERRANAFAVQFLAPRQAVKQLVPNPAKITAEAISSVMSKFGIGPAAARFHVGNAWYQRPEDLPPLQCLRGTPSYQQLAAEDFTQDFFPIQATPDQRRGRFALLTAEAVYADLITADTAAQYLTCSEKELRNSLPSLLDLAGVATEQTQGRSATTTQDKESASVPRKGVRARKLHRSAKTGRFVKNQQRNDTPTPPSVKQ